MGWGQKILASEEANDFIITINLDEQVGLVIANNPNLCVSDVEIFGSMLSVIKIICLGTDGRRHDLFFLGVDAEELQMKTERKEVIHTFNTNSTVMDPVMREMFKDSYFTDQVKGSYLNSGM